MFYWDNLYKSRSPSTFRSNHVRLAYDICRISFLTGEHLKNGGLWRQHNNWDENIVARRYHNSLVSVPFKRASIRLSLIWSFGNYIMSSYFHATFKNANLSKLSFNRFLHSHVLSSLLRLSITSFRKPDLVKLGCVERMVVDSILPHAECGPNDHRKDAPRLVSVNRI